MNDLFRPYLRCFIIVFFYDILVYSPTLEEHIFHLETAFKLLLDNRFHLKGSKCFVGQQSIKYLGHVVSAARVTPDPSKVQAIVNWPLPSSIKSLRGFLGLTGFYCRFVRGYASIASPLTDLLKKDNFLWTDSATAAFEALKSAVTTAPVLALPRFDSVFAVQTDASGTGMGVVLLQQGHPIAFFSKQFCPKLRNSSTYIRELCAITSAVQK
uniref:Retrovirus-related Pol polyprotein from transposon 297 family n=1 Tax=Cajanus cajan TaxID=3821 RepID=A0A151U7M1_CAJCA|nr:Retrovirus-related Pol polyprotein from transposon 297 family [Cajanus cajan]